MALLPIDPQSMSNEKDSALTIERNIGVPTRDDIILSTDVYRPREGTHPVVLIRTPYRKDLLMTYLGRRIASDGYAVVIQSCRGRYGSTGEFSPFRNEMADGEDTLKWIAGAPWANGAIGLLGWSYSVYCNYAIIVGHKPRGIEIAAAVSCMEAVEPYRTFYHSGSVFLHWALPWIINAAGRKDRELKPAGFTNGKRIEWQRVLAITPLDAVPCTLDLSLPLWDEVLRHESFDDYWKSMSLEPLLDRISVPILHVSGWFDYCLDQTLETYRRMAAGAAPQKLVIGPWDHERVFKVFMQDFLPLRDVEPYPSNSGECLFAEAMEWFGHWLKGTALALDRSKAVRVFVTRWEGWLSGSQWPPDGVMFQKLYMDPDRRLSPVRPPTQGCHSFLYDPADPVPTVGGAISFLPNVVAPGPHDQSALTTRADTLMYSTGPLESTLRIAGPLLVRLRVSSTTGSPDFTAKLLDVHPDGVVEWVQDGIVRVPEGNASIRIVEVNMGATAHRFDRGHAVGLAISSSNFPKYDRNLNTGSQRGSAATVVAKQTIYTGGDQPSYVQIPVLP